MTFPIFQYTEKWLEDKCSAELLDNALCGTLIADPLLFITSLVVGILGLTGAASMPAAAAYALIGVTSGISLLYIGHIIRHCCICTETSKAATM